MISLCEICLIDGRKTKLHNGACWMHGIAWKENTMSEIWKSLDIETYKYWAETIINEASDELTDWESGFIDSIHIKLSNGWNLTQAQATKLEKIYAEKTK
jgi:hypothetical protein